MKNRILKGLLMGSMIFAMNDGVFAGSSSKAVGELDLLGIGRSVGFSNKGGSASVKDNQSLASKLGSTLRKDNSSAIREKKERYQEQFNEMSESDDEEYQEKIKGPRKKGLTKDPTKGSGTKDMAKEPKIKDLEKGKSGLSDKTGIPSSRQQVRVHTVEDIKQRIGMSDSMNESVKEIDENFRDVKFDLTKGKKSSNQLAPENKFSLNDSMDGSQSSLQPGSQRTMKYMRQSGISGDREFSLSDSMDGSQLSLQPGPHHTSQSAYSDLMNEKENLEQENVDLKKKLTVMIDESKRIERDLNAEQDNVKKMEKSKMFYQEKSEQLEQEIKNGKKEHREERKNAIYDILTKFWGVSEEGNILTIKGYNNADAQELQYSVSARGVSGLIAQRMDVSAMLAECNDADGAKDFIVEFLRGQNFPIYADGEEINFHVESAEFNDLNKVNESEFGSSATYSSPSSK